MNDIPSFNEFIDSLLDAGWQSNNDAQHEHIRDVYANWVRIVHNLNVACEYWRLLAEKSGEPHKG